MRLSLTTAIFMLVSNFLFSQVVTTFPYLEDFETFPASTPGAGAVAEPNPNAFPNFWLNATTEDDPQDWYSVTGSTPSGNTGPTGDHTSGSGVYLYIEDSGAGANNDSIILFTPFFNVTSLTNPALSFYVHSDANTAVAAFGGDSSLNHLFVDYFDGTNWLRLDSIGVLQTGWTLRLNQLDNLPPIFRLRFVVNNNNYGDFIHDIAIDDVSVFDLPNIDGEITEGALFMAVPSTYTLAPISQSPIYQVGAAIRNNGLTTLTNVDIIAEYNSLSDTVSFDSLTSFTPAAAIFGTVNAVEGGGSVNLTLTSDQTDTIPNNTLAIGVNDTTFARDDSSASGGIGFTGATGIFGNMFELTQPDVLTSISFFLQSSILNDTMRILLYGFGNDVPGFPDTTAIMDSSVYFTISSLGWNSAEFTCQKELPAGQYFIAAEQVGLNNLGFGYDLDNYTVGTAFFGDGINQWVEIGAVPSLVSAFMIRMNFGPETKNASIMAGTDRICFGDSIALVSNGSGTFSWTGPNLSSMSGDTVFASPTATSTYSVNLVDANGCSSDNSFVLNVNPLPVPSIDGDTASCPDAAVTLTASGGSSYMWNTGEMTASISPVITASSTYTVMVSDSIGCTSVDSISVDVYPSASIGFDTTIAFFGIANGTATATATGGVAPYTYLWNDSTGQDSSTATGLAPGTYTVTVTDSNGCVTMDSVMVTEATTGINDLVNESLINIYPNPSDGNFTLSNLEIMGTNTDLTISITDLKGSRVFMDQVKGQNSLEVSLPTNMPNGVYMLEIRSEERRVLKKIILDK